MKLNYAPFFAAVLALCTSPEVGAQCVGTAAGLVPNANWTAPTLPGAPAWPNNYPPTASGAALAGPPAHCTANPPYSTNCNICPSTFTVNINAGQRAIMYLCANNIYTITMCTSVAAWDSEIAITNTANTVGYAFDDDGCGTPGGHAQLSFIPPTSQAYGIKVFGPGCTAPVQSGTLIIQCAAAPCPGPGNDPCAATPLASCNPNIPSCGATAGATAFPAVLSAACTTLNGSTAGATGTSGVAPPACGVYPNSGDVWFSATTSPIGTLALDVTHVSATNLAMALYSGGTCPGPAPALAAVTCNADLVAGTNQDPFISASGLTPNTVYYIRVWPEANVANGGTFQLCAYWPTPPPNDQPCGAIDLDMSNPNCVPATFNTQDATPLSGVTISTAGSPTCTGGVAGNDVWFRIVTPNAGRVTINTIAGSLTSMAMALYTGPCGGPLAEVGCNDNNPLGGNMPFLNPATVYPAATILWVRIWSQTTGFGTFQICAYMTQPPANDEPCGAIPISPEYGCMMTGISTENASQTSVNLYGAGSVPNPACGGTPNNDVWFSTVVPSNGQITLDMDDAQMNDAALSVYRRISGACPGGGNFTEIAGTCQVNGSANPGAGAMPLRTVTGLTPGETVYIRVWRQSGLTGTAHLCVRRTDTYPVVPGTSCYYTLRLNDSAGDGWNGSSVTIEVGGVPTSYTIDNSAGTISFPIDQNEPITITYNAVGGFQNQISYSVVNHLGGLIYSAVAPPATGLVFVDVGNCNLPPPPQSDCTGAFRLCNSGTLGGNPTNTGAVADLNSGNDGCLFGENQTLWYSFTPSTAGTFAFTIDPTAATYTDYDFALWGPQPGSTTCPPPAGGPTRCSYAAGGDMTGLDFPSVDLTEGAGGNSWVRYLDVPPAQVGWYYWLVIDNFSRNGISFNFSFSGTASISCTITPVELLAFDAEPVGREVDVTWSTSAERHTAYYIVERSTDGAMFEPIGQVNAVGNTPMRTDYKFTDASPKNGLNYYRLRQVDVNEENHLSEVKSVVFRAVGTPLFVFPNPATDKLVASFGSGTEGTLRWRVLDTSGRLVSEGSSAGVHGSNQFEVPVQTLDGGSYLLEVLDGSGALIGNARFVKQ